MKTVVTHLLGGLGNQLFQYAAGAAAAHRNGARLLVDRFDFSWYRRPYALGAFRVSAPYAGRLDRFRMGVARQLRSSAIRQDSGGYRYNPELLRMGDRQRIYLLGHWQNERYFSDVRAQLLDEFRLKPEHSVLDTELGRRITQSESVAVHVRRGDNIVKFDRKTGRAVPQLGMVSEAYLTAAMESVLQRQPQAKFFVFSDEIAWVRDNMQLPTPVTYATPEGLSDVQQFELMANCKHHIIANSTFSWWAAWLNDNPAKMVFAPKIWDVRDQNYDTGGLLPASWLRL